eukprot:scaffold27026_cov52-Phaeocystis_antarctica.AAC.2
MPSGAHAMTASPLSAPPSHVTVFCAASTVTPRMSERSSTSESSRRHRCECRPPATHSGFCSP